MTALLVNKMSQKGKFQLLSWLNPTHTHSQKSHDSNTGVERVDGTDTMVFSHPDSIQNTAIAPQLVQGASRSLVTSADTSAIVPPLCHSSCQGHSMEVFVQAFQLLLFPADHVMILRNFYILLCVWREFSLQTEQSCVSWNAALLKECCKLLETWQNPNFPAGPSQQVPHCGSSPDLHPWGQ